MSRNKQNEIKLNARPFHLVLSKGLLTKEEFGGVLGSVKFGSKLGLFLLGIDESPICQTFGKSTWKQILVAFAPNYGRNIAQSIAVI